MGYPMARNLLRAGHEVALWSNTAAKAQELAKAEKGIFCETSMRYPLSTDFEPNEEGASMPASVGSSQDRTCG